MYNTAAWILLGYAYLLALTTMLVFAWLFWRSPLHRAPVALCLCGQVVVRAAYGLKTAGAIPVTPVDPVILTFNFAAAMYALALFRFRMFNLIPIARGTVIDQMREGMLVLDGERRIMDLNPAAEMGHASSLTDLLHDVFGFPSFRPNQEAVCRAVMEGRDVLLVMPTGSGKSLCYQLPGIARGGTALVVQVSN